MPSESPLKWILDVGTSGDPEIQAIQAVIGVMQMLSDEYDKRGLSDSRAAKKRVLEYVVARDGLK